MMNMKLDKLKRKENLNREVKTLKVRFSIEESDNEHKWKMMIEKILKFKNRKFPLNKLSYLGKNT